jgi:hypothetical protein
MTEADYLYYDMQSIIERWLNAYPENVFPDLDTPPTPKETRCAVMLARRILRSLSLELEAVHMDHRAQREDKQEAKNEDRFGV